MLLTKHLYFSIFFYVILGIFLSSCSRNPVTGKKELSFMSESQERALGLQSDPQVVTEFGLYDDQAIQDFINEKGQEMVKVSHRASLPFEFKVLNSSVVNAFALPGGFVYFTRGILAHFNNEAEFAGVLGHEIGHVTARHGAQQYTQQMLSQIGFIAGMVISPTVRQFANEISQGIQLMMLSNSRADESQSDELGVEYSTKVGYDADYMAGFFTTLSRLGKSSGASEIPDFLSTHPNPDDRHDKVLELANNWKSKVNAAPYKVERNSYLELIDGIMYGDNPREGFTENNVFYHPDLKFTYPYPSGWQLVNSPSQVQIVGAEGNAMMIMSLAQGSSLKEAADGFIEQYQLQLVESGSKNVNGYPAYQIVADQVNQEAPEQSARLLAYFYQDTEHDLIYQILGVSAKTTFNQYSNYFLFTLDNFKKLTDSEKLNVQPERIKVVQVPFGMTVENAFRKYNIPTDRFEEFAVLNNMNLTDKLETNQYLKVVEKYTINK
ncbi:M48 family metalloprotease [Membranihabitans marinus]|uniref:M48 family metalloprotease n=1 Tax=Membranihabitans marinus TaxID=1227546 RepID=UPI001F0261E5|nr:M48 family metalloprotease [Membranihabitans marinus]